MEQLTQKTKERQEAQKRGILLGLSSMVTLLEALGNPQDSLRFCHIAGTNGKGSTAAFLVRILRNSGLTVGQYLSPGVISEREIIQVGGEMIPEDDYRRLFERAHAAAEKSGIAPSLFELETAMAFLYFEEMHCDIVVLECGLGGDLDATNVVTTTLCSILTSISLDHTGFLGNTTAEIASHKAGIIKPGVPVVAAWNEDAATRTVIEDAADALQAPLTWIRPEETNHEIRDGRSFLTFEGETYELGLAGTWQRLNGANAIAAARILAAAGLPVTREAIRTGLAQTVWPGRMQTLADKPRVIADGAHNPGAAEVLISSLRKYFTNKNFFYIIGMLRDKDVSQVLRTMLPAAKAVYALTPDSPRALKNTELAEKIDEIAAELGHEIPVTLVDGPVEGLRLARRAEAELGSEEDEVIVAFGSFTFLGELIHETGNDGTGSC